MPSQTSATRATKLQPTTAVYPPPDLPQPLPCPRCNSTNTKFCYYNNYNLAQPRHFCKSCRRYWTHGGTLRDIPVGGGTRRGSSTSASKRPRSSSSPSHITNLVPVESETMNLGNATSETSQTKESRVVSVYGSFSSLLDEESNGAFLALRSGSVSGGLHYGFEEMSVGYLGESTGEIPLIDDSDTWQTEETECIWPIL